ncbi:hypothetical protein BD310DRAFT_314451 [Dichomitus squalens]|uniref:Uncharacterized protein n=1 Tax=Dichomitus squalens TaxID=114155 RepID=A0A4Q9PFK3_9APHY|nr:hypothetical protein BD310DRAFT_314451 [Dichomitus squalens]
MFAADLVELKILGTTLSDVLGSYRNSLVTILLSRFLLDIAALGSSTMTRETSEKVNSTEIVYHSSDMPSTPVNLPNRFALEFWRPEVF